MCGIVGLVDPTVRSSDRIGEVVFAMSAAVAHRGPDGQGTWVDAERGIGLGHRRLSIIDLSDAGAQPMRSRDGRWVITFNGEIYNHREIARRLEAGGTRFRGHSDSEVLIEAIAAWGVSQTLDRIEGMFAFAVWDRDDCRVTLARDRTGEKPLFWARAGSATMFSSSLDAFLAHPKFDPTISPVALTAMLRYKYVPAPLSIYRDATKVLPGSVVQIEHDGTIGDPMTYWSCAEVAMTGQANPFRGSADDAVRELTGLIRSSVENRMIADVPVGAFLSGGIDSSTVVAFMVEQAGHDVQTFTIGSEHAAFNEATDAARVAAHLGTKHHELVVSGADALAVVSDLPRIFDEPFGDSSQIPTLLVSRLARSSVTVALSGDGGDELFGGYNRHRWIPAIHRRSRYVPHRARQSLAGAVERVGPHRIDRASNAIPARWRPRQLGLKLEKVANIAAMDDITAMYVRTVSHWADPVRAVRDGRDPLVVAADSEAWPPLSGPTAQMMAVDLMTYLPDDILAKVDRATMAVGLEGRIPLLDRRIIEFAATLPPDLFPGAPSKQILREIVYSRVPRELLDRPKAGFGVPLDAWLRGPLRRWGNDLLDDPAAGEHLHLDVIRDVWSAHQQGHHNHGFRLWDVLMFLAWSDDRRRS